MRDDILAITFNQALTFQKRLPKEGELEGELKALSFLIVSNLMIVKHQPTYSPLIEFQDYLALLQRTKEKFSNTLKNHLWPVFINHARELYTILLSHDMKWEAVNLLEKYDGALNFDAPYSEAEKQALDNANQTIEDDGYADDLQNFAKILSRIDPNTLPRLPLDLANLHMPLSLKWYVLNLGDVEKSRFLDIYNEIIRYVRNQHDDNLPTTESMTYCVIASQLLPLMQGHHYFDNTDTQFFSYLSMKIVHSLDAYFRYLEATTITEPRYISAIKSFISNNHSHFHKKSEQQLFFDKLPLLAALHKLTSRLNKEDRDITNMSAFFTDLPPAKFYETIQSVVYKALCAHLGVESREFLQRFSDETLIRMINGLQSMKGSHFEDIYLELIKYDINKLPIDGYIHHSLPDNKLSRLISYCNRMTKLQLRYFAVDANMALHYKKQDRYILKQTDSNAEKENAIYYLYELSSVYRKEENHQEALSPLQRRAYEKIDRHFQQVHKSLEKKDSNIERIRALCKLGNVLLLTKINHLLNGMLKARNTLTDTFIVFADRYTHAFTRYKSLIENNETQIIKTREKPLAFEVSMHDKLQHDTLWLGDETSCCLASNSPNFKSMVLTRVLDAMPVFTVIDKEKGKKAGLIWFHFSFNQGLELCLYAEYLELNNHYLSPTSKEAIVYMLLNYSADYFDALKNVKHFFIAKHPYGMTKGITDDFPLGPTELLGMLGGPLFIDGRPRNCRSDQYYVDHYTLASYGANCKQAHRFSREVLEKKKPAGLVSLHDLLHHWTTQATPEDIKNSLDFKHFIIAQVGFLIDPLFEKSLFLDESFTRYIEHIWQENFCPTCRDEDSDIQVLSHRLPFWNAKPQPHLKNINERTFSFLNP